MRKAEEIFKNMCEEMPWSFVGKKEISPYIVEAIKLSQLETIEETCKVCAEKANAKIITEWSGNTGSEYCDKYAVVDKQSILNCIEILKKEYGLL